MCQVVAARWPWYCFFWPSYILLGPPQFAASERNTTFSSAHRAILEQELTTNIANLWTQCTSETIGCPIGALGKDVAQIFQQLRGGFTACRGLKCTYNQINCNTFWAIQYTPLNNLRATCQPNDWPPSCQNLYTSHTSFQTSSQYQLYTLCSLIQPGWGFVRNPQCRTLVEGTVKKEPSLQQCSGMQYNDCVTYFCKVYSDFRHRIRPRNMQNDPFVNQSTLWPSTTILSGCADVEKFPFTEQDCPNRKDIHGICGCLCMEFPNMAPTPAIWSCPTNIDEYLLLGRLGVRDIILNNLCEDAFCSLLDKGRLRCPTQDYPNVAQCKALQIPALSSMPHLENCPWRNHSGQDGVMVCLDGTSCRPDTDTWSCCFAHRGRAKCPKDLPKMCNTLCSGHNTEYCCEESRSTCTLRPCPAILVPDQILIIPTTPVPTQPPSIPATGETSGKGFSISLPPGSWVWLLLIIPMLIGVGCVFIWHRYYKASQFIIQEAKGTSLDEEYDRQGRFHIVRKKYKEGEELSDRAKTRVKIVVEDLPMTKPLGLEINETKVTRVREGSVWGWCVGDNIIQVGGFPVYTFEEIWARIQIERDRLPTTFLVERQAHAQQYVDNIRGREDFHTSKIADSGSRSTSKLAASEEASRAPGSRVPSKLPESDTPSRTPSRYGPGSRVSSKLIDSRATSKLADSRNTSKLPESRIASKLESVFEDGGRSAIGSRVSSKLETSSMNSSLRDASDPVRIAHQQEMERRFKEKFHDIASKCSNKAWQDELDVEAVEKHLDLAMENRNPKVLKFAIAEAVGAGLPATKVKEAQDILSEEIQAQRMANRRGQKTSKDSDSEDEEQRDGDGFLRPALQNWWVENEDAPSEQSAGAYGDWRQYRQIEDEQPSSPKTTTWQEARDKGHSFAKTFEEHVPYHAWLLNAQNTMNSYSQHDITTPGEVGEPKEWVCSVCKRPNKITERKCSVCTTEKNYNNKKLDAAAQPQLLLHDYGVKKTVDPHVRFKKDACGRMVYDVVP